MGNSKNNTSLIYGLFLAFLVWVPLPMGSNRAWAWSLAEVWVFALLAWWLVLYLRGTVVVPPALKKARFVIALYCGWLLLVVVQIVPLPISVVEVVSPAVLAVADRAGDVQRESILLSLDVYATQAFLLKSLMYLSVFLLSLLLLNTRERIRQALTVLVLVGLFQAVLGAMMVFTGYEHGFFFEKDSYRGVATGTFVNRNHLAGHLEMVLAAGIGLLLADTGGGMAISWRQRLRNLTQWLLSPKMRLRIYLAVMVIGLVLTHSRMGNTAFFSSLLIASLIWLLLTKKSPRGPAVFLLVSLFVIDIYIVGAWFGIDKVVERLEKTSVDSETRDEVVQYGIEYFKDFPYLGSGGGTFYSVFPAYRGEHVAGFYDQAHNDYLQMAVETGGAGLFLLGSMVVLSFGAAFWSIYRRQHSLYRGLGFAGVMGILSLMIHSSVDFNLQIPANAVYFMILLAFSWLAIGMPRRSE